MRSLCLYFQVHQPFRLRTFRFFDIGVDSNYYDEYQNKFIIKRIAEKCYLPANQLLLEQINKFKGAFRVTFSISGTAIDQFQRYAPEVIGSFRQLADTGCVEFLGETYGHSLAGLKNADEFNRQVQMHTQKIVELFGIKPTSFRNTELIYSDETGEMVANMGFKSILAEGARHVLGWRSPNFIYYNSLNPKLKVLLRNFRLSDDIGFRFSNKAWSEWPLTTEKYVEWLNAFDDKQQIVNVFLDYETFGEHQWKETGIFDFLADLPAKVLENSDYQFHTPSQVADIHQPVAPIHVPYATSWADEERDLTAWLGNELQDEAASSLYALAPKVYQCDDPSIWNDWMYLQTSDHFYYMCTKWFSDGEVHKYFNPYQSPYEAYINYMNVLSDFIVRIDKNAKDKMPYQGWPSLYSVAEYPQAGEGGKVIKQSAKPKPGKQANDFGNYTNPELKKGLVSIEDAYVAVIIMASEPILRERLFSLLPKKRAAVVRALSEEIARVNPATLKKAIKSLRDSL